MAQHEVYTIEHDGGELTVERTPGGKPAPELVYELLLEAARESARPPEDEK